jgi:hypothetical protein
MLVLGAVSRRPQSIRSSTASSRELCEETSHRRFIHGAEAPLARRSVASLWCLYHYSLPQVESCEVPTIEAASKCMCTCRARLAFCAFSTFIALLILCTEERAGACVLYVHCRTSGVFSAPQLPNAPHSRWPVFQKARSLQYSTPERLRRDQELRRLHKPPIRHLNSLDHIDFSGAADRATLWESFLSQLRISSTCTYSKVHHSDSFSTLSSASPALAISSVSARRSPRQCHGNSTRPFPPMFCQFQKGSLDSVVFLVGFTFFPSYLSS